MLLWGTPRRRHPEGAPLSCPTPGMLYYSTTYDSLLFDGPASLLVLEPVARWLLRRRRHSPRDFEASDA